VRTRFDYRQTFKQPYFVYEQQDLTYWTPNTILSHDNIRLTPSVPDARGALWATHPNPHKEWQVIFQFGVYGRGQNGGEGFALWYTEKPMGLGPVYGSEDKWKGVGVIFDTTDTVEQRYTPYIYAQYNDGTKELAHSKDYAATALAGCFRDYRNTPSPVWGRLTYANTTLQLDIDLTQHGKGFIPCFVTVAGLNLPPNYYFGFSAATEGHLVDDHDIISFETYEINPDQNKKSKPVTRPHEKAHIKAGDTFKLSDDIKKNIEQFEKVVGEAWEQEKAEDWPETLTPHVIQQLQGNQFHMLEQLNHITKKLEDAAALGDVPAGSDSSHSGQMGGEVKAVMIKLAEMTRQIHALEQSVQNLNDHSVRLTNGQTSTHAKLDQVIQSANTDRASAQEATQSAKGGSSWPAGTIGFAGGIIVAWAANIIARQLRKEKPKKFI
ncbi:legume-like lectin family-domain-containing protein, partial [Phlyctochytrium arcticum]